MRERRDVGDDATWERDVAYEYDADSNRTRKIDHLDPTKTLTYFYEPGSHRLARIEKGGVTHRSFTWTANGEMATKTTVGTGTEKYAWGLDGTLSSALLPDGRKVVYGYDHHGQLVSRKLYSSASGADPPLTDVRYLVDNQNPTGYSQILAEIDGKTGAVLRLNTFLDRVFAQTSFPGGAESTQFPLVDALGSVRSVLSIGSSGVTTQTDLDYTAFGSPLEPEPRPTDYAFTGERRDPDTALQYHRDRWLMISNGGWLSPDKVFDFPGNLGHSYNYVGHNSPNSIDPSGMTSLLNVLSSSVIIAMLAGILVSVLMNGIYNVFISQKKQSFFDGWKEAAAFGALIGAAAGLLYGVLFWLLISTPAVAGGGLAYTAGYSAKVAGMVTVITFGAPLNVVLTSMGLSAAETTKERGFILLVGVVNMIFMGFMFRMGRTSTKPPARAAGGMPRRPLPSTIQEVMNDPLVLRGREYEALRVFKSLQKAGDYVEKAPGKEGWKLEPLGGKRRSSGQAIGYESPGKTGVLIRHYGKKGQGTGRRIGWQPGGGMHGPDPYFTVIDKSGVKTRVGPEWQP